MILEGIVTTVSPQGDFHLAPMGPRVEMGIQRFLLRPFPTSQSYQNLLAHPEGVLHVTDDVLLLARGAIGAVEELPQHRPAEKVRGFVLSDACRAYEFRVQSIDDSEVRVKMTCEVVNVQRFRDFFGFNRAKHAVVEAAILASRVHLLAPAEIASEFIKLKTIVVKTGGEQELQAFELLRRFVEEFPSRP
ncbi:MAG TPA: DUF447 domain-containing protein [Gemmataceae bacterium]|jgi:hypothetical protein|nr:DUF447 domain-containing protein [Gemmataceae bacterium]